MSPDQLPRSPLSDDPAYWDRLARRITADASAPLASYAALRRSPVAGLLGVLARSAPWTLAAAAAAMILLWLGLPPSPPDSGMLWLEPSVAPRDPAGILLAGSLPPTVDRVLVEFPPPAGEEAP